jgi:hypothetical protein
MLREKTHCTAIKMKNAAHPAVKREEEEDWGR